MNKIDVGNLTPEETKNLFEEIVDQLDNDTLEDLIIDMFEEMGKPAAVDLIVRLCEKFDIELEEDYP